MLDSKGKHLQSQWVRGDPESRRTLRDSPPHLVLSDPIPAHVVDISVSGLGLEASSPFEPLEQHKFRIEMGQAQATALGEVRWCRQEGTTITDDGASVPVYRVGVAFLEDVVLSW